MVVGAPLVWTPQGEDSRVPECWHCRMLFNGCVFFGGENGGFDPIAQGVCCRG
jgi:hypothetical protein